MLLKAARQAENNTNKNKTKKRLRKALWTPELLSIYEKMLKWHDEYKIKKTERCKFLWKFY